MTGMMLFTSTGFKPPCFCSVPFSGIRALNLRESKLVYGKALKRRHVQSGVRPRTIAPCMSEGMKDDTGKLTTRRFSNVDKDTGFQRVQASEWGCGALVAGTTIGAGVLAMPAATAGVGFLGSSLALIGVWIYMMISGLLIAEVGVETSCALGRPSGVSLLGMAKVIFGEAFVEGIVGLVYGGLHYAILTAYTAQGGAVLRDIIGSSVFDGQPTWLPQVVFGGVLCLVLYYGSDKFVENMNNLLVGGVLVVFGGLVYTSGRHLDLSALLSVRHFGEIPKAIPVLLVAMVYHNVVNTVSSRLEGDFSKIRRVIAGGTTAPLVMFLIWNAVILNLAADIQAPVGSFDPLELLRTQGGFTSNLINTFSIFAIVTSFIGFIYGLVDFLNDLRIAVLRQQPSAVYNSEWVSYLLAMFPPIVIAASNSSIFYTALDAAGVYGIAALFGILPAAMAWRKRYAKVPSYVLPSTQTMVPGGRLLLAGMIVAPSILITQKVLSLGWHL